MGRNCNYLGRRTYEPIEEVGEKNAQEEHLLKAFKEGSIKFRMHGKKLKGEFALVRTRGMQENSWLLIKDRQKNLRPKTI